MRQIATKYAGECRKCAATLSPGQPAMYEKYTGIFCVGCQPTDPEEIRAYRQERADRKAARFEEWAEKRETRANAALNSHPEMRHDWAFITQPGHIPARARMIAADERAFASLKKAEEMQSKAHAIRSAVCVKGDRERAREKERAFTRKWIAKGMRVTDAMYGAGTVTRVNQKTASVKHDRCSKAYPICLSWLAPEDRNEPAFRAAIEAYKAEKAAQVPA